MKKLLKISYYILLLGWFMFMFLAMYGSSLSFEWRISILLGGLLVCLVGSLSITMILPGDEHFNTIMELRKAKKDYEDATNKLMGEFYRKMRNL